MKKIIFEVRNGGLTQYAKMSESDRQWLARHISDYAGHMLEYIETYSDELVDFLCTKNKRFPNNRVTKQQQSPMNYIGGLCRQMYSIQDNGKAHDITVGQLKKYKMIVDATSVMEQFEIEEGTLTKSNTLPVDMWVKK